MLKVGKFSKLAAAAAVATVMSLSSASAVTITAPTDGTSPVIKSVDITCTFSCEFWWLGSDPDGFSAANGSWLNSAYGGVGTGNSNTDRTTFVNNVLGLTAPDAFVEQWESSDSGAPGADLSISGSSWTSSALYFLAWGGEEPRYVLIKNLSANNTFTWDAGTGSGLSGVDGFGVIPLPAAGWLMLSVLGLGGLVAHRKRKQKMAV